MFHWICPECGREIPPTVKECQACDPNAAQKIAVEPSMELAAETVAAPLPPPLPEPTIAATSAAPIAIPVAAPLVPSLALESLCENGDRTPPSPAGLVTATRAVSDIRSPAGDGGVERGHFTQALDGGEPPVPDAVSVADHNPASNPAEAIDIEPGPSETVSAANAPIVAQIAEPTVAVEAPSPEPTEPPVAAAIAPVDHPFISDPEPEPRPAEAVSSVESSSITAEETPAPQIATSAPDGDGGQEDRQPNEANEAREAHKANDTEPQPPAVESPIETALSALPATTPLLPAPRRVVADEFAETLELPIPVLSAPYEVVARRPRPIEAVSAAQPAVISESEDEHPAEAAKTIDTEPQVETAISVAEAAAVEVPIETTSLAEPVTNEQPVAIAANSDSKTIDIEPPARPTEAAGAPSVEPEPKPEPILAEAVAPEPPSLAQPPAPETLIPVHELPDPLLALAEEIRAAQAARAATGLFKLAGAIGVREPEPEPTPAPAEASAHQAPPQPGPVETTALKTTPVEAAAPIALLAPPEPEPATAHVNVPEPAGIQDARPVALAPVPQPAAEPEPTALAEPQAQPTALATEPSREGPTLPLAPLQHYTPATSTSIQPVPPKVQILAAETGPRITLPGPTLPPQLARLQEANVVTIIGEDTAIRKKEAIESTKPGAGTPGWLVSGLVMLLLLAVGLAAVFYLFPHSVADAKPAPMPAVAATSPAPTGGNSPLAKFIEVTGFRIITSSADSNKKSEVQYLVINHSDADISDANVFITLRGTKPAQAPLCRFSFKIPSLGPYESKEMSSPIEKSPRALTLPDWQDLRAEVQITQ